MYKRTFWGFATVALLMGGCIWLISAVPMQLGIDLQGGTELTYILDLSRIEGDRSQIASEVKDVISKRLDAFGLKEISISVQGADHLVIQLPGRDVQSVGELKNQIEKAGNLTFRIVSNMQPTPEEVNDLKREELEHLERDREWIEKSRSDPAFREQRPKPPDHLVRYEVKREVVDGRTVFVPLENAVRVLENSHPTYNEEKRAWEPQGIVSGEYLNRVNTTVDENYRPAVSFIMTGEGAALFSDLTRANIKRPLAIVLDDDIMQVATIQNQISSSGQITGDFTEDEIKGIITILRGGSLKTKPKLISESTVGSVLGQDAIDSGIRAIAAGLAGVVLLLAIYYMVGGLVADFALMLNVLFILAFVVCFRQTLTLPGIAGILLTLGMSVDANILIFERYREERKKGKPFAQSLTAAYSRAFWVIFDTNLTTLITGFVLFHLGTGPVKGFAVTLITGIMASFFTAVYATRIILSQLARWGILKDLKMLEAFDTPRIPFTVYQRPFLLASAGIIAVTWVFVIWRGHENYGIDFTGGARITMNLARPLPVEEMRAKVSALANERPDLFRDWSLQTLDADDKGVTRTFAVLTRAGGTARIADAEEAKDTPPPAPPPAGGQAPSGPAKAEGEAAPGSATDTAPAGAPPPAPEPAPRAAITAAPPETAVVPPREPAQLVREVIEDMLQKQSLLIPPPFPYTRWEIPTTPGLPPGSTRLVMEVNLLQNVLTTEDLRKRLQESLDKTPLFTRNGREASTYKGIEIESLDLVEKAAEASPADRFVVRTAPFVPELVAARLQPEAVRTPTKEEVEERGIRRFFRDGSRARLFQISEPFSEVATVGPRVAQSLQADALVALFISVLGIIFYLSLRFEFIYGLAGIIALCFDVMVTIGIVAVTDTLFPTTFPVKLNLNELAAILTIIGFSINDSIVCFDRIRENSELLARRKMTLEDNVNISINQTLSRTIATSTLVLLTSVMLLAFGGEAIRGFAFVFTVGTVAGVYSSVFIASPIVIWLHKRALARRQAMAAAEDAA